MPLKPPNKKYFKLFSNCIPVKGAKNHIICDLALNRYINIPDLMYWSFTNLKKKSVSQIKKHFRNRIDKEIDKLFLTLMKEDWGFYTNALDSFPEIALQYSNPLVFSNAIFDYNKDSKYNLVAAIEKIDKIGCKAIQIRFFYEPELVFLQSLLTKTNNLEVNYIEVALNGNENFNISLLKSLFKENARLRKVILYGQLSNENLKLEEDYVDYGSIHKRKERLQDESSCGKVRKENFISDVTLFSESQKFNNCLNKKISVDKNGLVKNCPSMNFDFGKIEKTDILNVSKKVMFRQYWEISKDKVEICKDCEFRYICVDCRAYTRDPDNNLSKPLKCSYNPYLGSWE